MNNQVKSKYDLQAERFVNETGIIIEKKYICHDKFFPEDKEARAIFKITIERKGLKGWSFRFGQSIVDSYNILRSERHQVRTAPSDYDILSCITKSDPGIFNEFCANYGYDDDSRKAEKIYFDVQKEWSNVNRLFSDKEIEQLNEIN